MATNGLCEDVPGTADVDALTASPFDEDGKVFNQIEADVSEPQPKDRTAAKRQRRYREHHRNGVGRDATAEAVTHNGETVTDELLLRLVATEVE